ncbi:MAG: glycerophosphodiester phosphodiesterase [Halanaerobiales bacterium]
MNIIAHRGASGTAPENTGAAFSKAVEKNSDGVEFDIHFCRDNEIVVIHDCTVDRTTDGSGEIRDLTLNEIKQLDAGRYYAPEFKGEKLLTLQETLDIVAELELINIEIKGNDISREKLKRVLNIIYEYDIEDNVIISSFNHYALKDIKQLDDNIKTGILYFAEVYNPWDYAAKLQADAIHPYLDGVEEQIVNGCHKNNVEVNVFGVNNEEEIKSVKKMGVDAVITDYPAYARKIIRD